MNEAEVVTSLASLRDTLRSAKRWQELLTEAERRRLLSDLARVGLAIGRDLSPERPPNDLDIGKGNDSDPCPRERLAFLQTILPRVTGALRMIANAPPSAVTVTKRSVPVERARRVMPHDVLTALRTGDLLSDDETLPLPRRVNERIAIPCFDTPANRGVKTMLTHYVRDLTVIARVAESLDITPVMREAMRIRARLRSALRQSPWDTLPPLATVPPLSPSLRSHGAYRLLHDQWRQYREGFSFDWSVPLFSLPARDTWVLYEFWCLFQLADAVRTLGGRAVRADAVKQTRDGLTMNLAKGNASVLTFALPDKRRVTLTYNRRFERAESDNVGWYSRSHALMPDLTVECNGRLLIFDAKFKTYAGPGWELEDIRQMHSYRDAIRHGDERAVVGAWLLYAGRVNGANRPLIAYPESTTARPYGNNEVGAILLRPNAEANEYLQNLLLAFIK